MFRLFVPWLNSQPDDNIPSVLWADYQNTIGAVVLVGVLIFIAIILVLYHNAVKGRKIQRPGDPFKAFTPVRWLFLAAAPAVLVFAVTWHLYGARFPEASASFTGSSASVGLYAGVLTFLGAYGLMPALTPAKFKYRVRRLS
jgi:hypothetical protein